MSKIIKFVLFVALLLSSMFLNPNRAAAGNISCTQFETTTTEEWSWFWGYYSTQSLVEKPVNCIGSNLPWYTCNVNGSELLSCNNNPGAEKAVAVAPAGQTALVQGSVIVMGWAVINGTNHHVYRSGSSISSMNAVNGNKLGIIATTAALGGWGLATVYQSLAAQEVSSASTFVRVTTLQGDATLNLGMLPSTSIARLMPESLVIDTLEGFTVYIAETGQELTMPEFDGQAMRHAMETRAMVCSRNKDGSVAASTGFFKVQMCYNYLKENRTGLYFSPIAKTIVVVANEPGNGAIAIVFNAMTNSAGDPVGLGNARTLIVGGTDIEKVLRSSCASYRLIPLPITVDTSKEPPPIGQGTCLKNGNRQ